AHHGVAGRDAQVLVASRAADVWEAVRRTRPQAAPRLYFSEILFTKTWVVLGNRFDDPFDANRIDIFVEAGDLHGASETKCVSHRCDSDASFGEDGAEFGNLRRVCER